jgi:hypothetical protein
MVYKIHERKASLYNISLCFMWRKQKTKVETEGCNLGKLVYSTLISLCLHSSNTHRDHRGHDRMVVECTTIYATSAYHH